MNGMMLGSQLAPAPADPNEILTVQQAARALKVSYSHMLRLIRGEVTGMPPVHHVRAGVACECAAAHSPSGFETWSG